MKKGDKAKTQKKKVVIIADYISETKNDEEEDMVVINQKKEQPVLNIEQLMKMEQDKYKRMTNIKSQNLKKDVQKSILHVDKILLQK